MLNKTIIRILNANFEYITMIGTDDHEPSAKYYVYSQYPDFCFCIPANLPILTKKLSNGDIEKLSYIYPAESSWHKSKALAIVCNLLVVDHSIIDYFTTNGIDPTLVVKNKGSVNLLGGNTVIVGKIDNSLKITLTTPEFLNSVIKDTESLLGFAQAVLDLQISTSTEYYNNFSLFRTIKSIRNLSNDLTINQYKLLLCSKEVAEVSNKIEKIVDQEFYKLYSICDSTENTIFDTLSTEIIGEIGSYILPSDITFID